MTRKDAIEILEEVKTIDDSMFVYNQAYNDALDMAIEALKVQKPRVTTLKEAQTALHNDDVVWVELKDKIICAGIRMDGTDYFTMQNNDVLDVTDFDSEEGAEVYGKQVRCWTSRPTDEQREATPWERLN